MLATQWQNAVPLWFAVRVDLVASVTMIAIGSLCVIYRETADPIFLAMLLFYSVQLQQHVISTIRIMMQVEGRMVNAERCLKLLKAPQEDMRGLIPLVSFKQ